MKQASTALQNYLAANSAVVMRDLYTFKLASGLVLRYAENPTSLTVPASGFPGSPLNGSLSAPATFLRGPGFGRSKVSFKIGLDPSELDISVFPGPADLIGTYTWQNMVLTKQFDGAWVELDRLFLPQGGDGVRGPLDTSLGCIAWFYGWVADIDSGRSKIDFKVKSPLNLLAKQQMPRRLYMAQCSHIFGDAMCGYNRTAGANALGTATGFGAVTVIAQAGSTQQSILTNVLPANTYVQGTLIGLTGANVGLSGTIFAVSGGTMSLTTPFPVPVVGGDTFTLLPGCPHTIAGCTVLNNLSRFGGFPFIPAPETAV